MEKKNDTPIKTQVYNLVILDKSGSMESIRKEAIDGYNETLGGEGNQLYSKIEFYQLWDKGYSIKKIAEFVGCARSTVYEALLDYENYSVEESLRRRAENNQRRVCQFDLSGSLLNTFNSVKEAEIALGIKGRGAIGQCCAGKIGHKTVKGYLWLWEEDKYKINELVKSLDNGHREQKVAQLDKDGNVIAIFNSAKEAAQSFGYDYRQCFSHVAGAFAE